MTKAAKMVAYIGITCTNCKAFAATQEDDAVKRRDRGRVLTRARTIEGDTAMKKLNQKMSTP